MQIDITITRGWATWALVLLLLLVLWLLINEGETPPDKPSNIMDFMKYQDRENAA